MRFSVLIAYNNIELAVIYTSSYTGPNNIWVNAIKACCYHSFYSITYKRRCEAIVFRQFLDALFYIILLSQSHASGCVHMGTSASPSIRIRVPINTSLHVTYKIRTYLQHAAFIALWIRSSWLLMRSIKCSYLTDLLSGIGLGNDVKKSITLSFFNRITFHFAVRCRTFQEINA